MIMDIYAASLARIRYLGARRIRALICAFGGAEQAWKSSDDDMTEALLRSETAGEHTARRASLERKHIDPEQEGRLMEKHHVRCCTFLDSDYPPLLASTSNPPAVLFCKGAEPVWEKTIAVVGSRKATAYGKNAAEFFSSTLAGAGVCIVSGGARGVDSAAHRGCMKSGSPTAAVMACGLDVIYPPENRHLFESICDAGGALLSEFPVGTEPLARQFPSRNRIIAGMCRGVLVTEAAERSGSLITADFALEEGRDVFSVPGSIWSKTSRGTNRLIRSGGICVGGPEDILSEYGWDGTAAVEEKKEVCALTLEEEVIFRFCSLDASVSEEEIIEKSGFSLPKISMILLSLQIKEFIREIGNHQYTAVIR